MANIDYEIQSISTDESKNLNHGISCVKSNNNTSFWQQLNQKQEIVMRIQFNAATIQNIRIKSKMCESVFVNLFNVNDDGKSIGTVQLEKITFIRDEMEQVKQVKSDTSFEYAELYFRPKNGMIAIYFIGLQGQFKQAEQIKNPVKYLGDQLNKNSFSAQQTQSSAQRSLFSQRFKSPEKILFIQEPQTMNHGQNLVNRSQQQIKLRKSELPLFSSNPVKRNVNSDIELAIKNSLLDQQKLQQASLGKIEEEQLLKVIEELEDERQPKEQEFDLMNQIEQIESISQNQSRQRQSMSIKKTLFDSKTKVQEIQVIGNFEKQIEDLDDEQMTQYSEMHISKGLVDYQKILEMSQFRSQSLFDMMNNHFKPFNNIYFYINSVNISDFEQQQIEMKIKKIGGIIQDAVTNQTSYIISDTPVKLTNKYRFQQFRNISPLVVERRFIEELKPNKIPKPDKYTLN